MKPLLLKMAGLQSYREEQEIDFTKLCGAGVFGIFGPTGSGKSTILDAITLALFGRVERANGGTQGIMNQVENKLYVAFTFELTGSSGSVRYQVERQFKRNSDVSINNTVARLTHIQENDESVVLADKAGEVTAEVQQILGLNMADFTRAVVLPQGKFAEFLLLTGKDRRAMLQRLFHLERYGDQLSAKVSSKLKETDATLTAIVAEQAGLGDASEAVLETAKTDYTRLQVQAEEERSKVAANQQTVDAYKEVVDLQDESEKLNKQFDEVLQHEQEIVELETQLQLAERAEKVRPYLEEWDASTKLDQEKRTRLVGLEQVVLEAEALLSRTQMEFETAQQALAQDEERLITRVEMLKGALELETEIAQEQSEANGLKLRAAEIFAAFEQSQLAYTQAEARRDKALLLQTELQSQLKALSVSAEDRQKLKEATAVAGELQHIQKQMKDSQQEVTKCTESLASWKSKRLTADRELNVQYEEQYKLVHTLVTLQHEHQIITEQCETIEKMLDRILSDVKLLREQREREGIAALISKQLLAGEACPVCGSNDHPAPAHEHTHRSQTIGTIDQETQENKELINCMNECEQSIHSLRELRIELKGSSIRLSNLEKSIRSVLVISSLSGQSGDKYAEVAASVAAKEKSDELVANLIGQADGLVYKELIGATDKKQVGSGVNAAFNTIVNTSDNRDEDLQLKKLTLEHAAVQANLDQLRAMLNQLDQQMLETEQLVAKGEKTIRELDNVIRDCVSQDRMLTELYTGHTHKLTEFTYMYEERQQIWRTNYNHDDFSVIEAQALALDDKDRKADEVRERIEKSGPVIEGMQAELERMRTQIETQRRDHILLISQAESTAERAQAKTLTLRARVGDEPVPELIAASTAALSSLRERARAAAAAHEQARAAHAAAAEQRSAAAEGAAAATRSLASAERRLREALEAAAFATGEAAMAALLASEAASEATARVRAHREREAALRARREALEAKLFGRVVTPEQWAEAQAELRTAQEQRELALQAAARADHALNELTLKHARWSMLEQRRAEQEVQRGRLQKLQSVLKANAFVEFLAEEQLLGVSRAASERLGKLTRRRYALEVDSGGGFVIRDDANGGVKRPVSTLSGGETFLTSLALALALSAQIQLKGEYPLEFFFLDEGFGTLDGDLLDTVITALERLHTDRVAVGVISHVPELKARLPRKLIVYPAEASGRGSRIELEEG